MKAYAKSKVAADQRDWPRRAQQPLRLVAWGTLIYIVDIQLNDIDFLPDVVGVMLIAMGVWPLCSYRSNQPHYETVMWYVRCMSVVVVAHVSLSLLGMWPASFEPAWPTLGLMNVLAMLLFCTALRWMAEDNQLWDAARSWKTTTELMGVLWLGPLGMYYMSAQAALLSQQTFAFNLGPWMLIVLPMLLVPLVHFYISTGRMLRAT